MHPYQSTRETKSFKVRYPVKYIGFKQLKKDIRKMIDENIPRKEVIVNGYAESGKENAIRNAISEVLDEKAGIEKCYIITWHMDVFHICVFKHIDGKKHFILTFSKKEYEKYLKWVAERKNEL